MTAGFWKIGVWWRELLWIDIIFSVISLSKNQKIWPYLASERGWKSCTLPAALQREWMAPPKIGESLSLSRGFCTSIRWSWFWQHGFPQDRTRQLQQKKKTDSCGWLRRGCKTQHYLMMRESSSTREATGINLAIFQCSEGVAILFWKSSHHPTDQGNT